MRKVVILGVLLLALGLLSGAGALTALGVPAWFTSGTEESSDLVVTGDADPTASSATAAPRLEGTTGGSSGGRGGQGERGALPRHRITGRCVDEAGKGVAGARVLSIPDTSGKLFRTAEVGQEECPACAARADSEGRFVVEVKKEAPFHVVLADAHGFGWNGKGDLPIGADVTIVLRPARTLKGKVVDAAGAPIAGARVRALLLVDTVQHEIETTSAADGRYVLDGFPSLDPPKPGVWPGFMSVSWLEASARGYAPLLLAHENVGRGWSSERDLTLSKGSVVKGRVEDAETGRPVPRATVVLHSREGAHGYSRQSGAHYSNPWSPRALARTEAGEDGTFVIEQVPSLGVHGTSSNNMLPSGQRSLGGVGAWADGYGSTAVDVAVVPDGEVQEVVLRLERSARITGRVVEANGRPVAGATVYVAIEGRKGGPALPKLHEGAPLAHGTSGDDGRFVIPAAPALSREPREVVVSAYPGRAFERRGMPKPAQRKVSITASVDVDVGDLAFPAPDPMGPSCVLVVETPQGLPCFGAMLGQGGFGGDRTDAEGRLTFTWSAPTPERPSKEVHLLVRAPGFAPTPVTLVPPPDGPAEVRVRLEPAFRLEGTLVRADGTPAASEPITVANGTLPLERAFPKDLSDAHQQLMDGPRAPGRPAVYAVSYSDAEGRFLFEGLPSGPWHVRATQKRRVPPLPGAPRLDATVSDVASDTLDLVVRLPLDDSPVTGRLLVRVLDDATGEPVRDALLLVRQEGRVVASAGSRGLPGGVPRPPPAAVIPVEPSGPGREPGTYRVTEVPVGRVSLHIDAPGRRPATVEDLEVVAEQELRPPDVRLTRGTCVSGRVTLPQGEKANERQVVLHELGASHEAQPRFAPLAADGSFSTCGFGPGRYRAVCLHQGFRRDLAPLVPVAGTDVTVGPGASDVRIEGAWVPTAILSIRPDDARLPPSPWDSEALTHERKVFGAATRLTVRDGSGKVLLDVTGVRRHWLGSDGTQYLPAGRYTVRIEFPGGEAREESVDLAVGATGDVTLRKKP